MRSMNTICVLILLSIIFFPTSAVSELFPISIIENDVAYIYHITTLKEEKYKNKKWGLFLKHYYAIEQHQRFEEPDGERITITTEGIDKDFGKQVRIIEFKVKNSRLRQTYFQKEIIKFSGKKVNSYVVDLEELSAQYPEDTYTTEAIYFLLRGLELNHKTKFRFHWWGSETSIIPMYAKINKKQKKISVPAGTFTCFSAKLFVDVSDFLDRGEYINTLISPFMPDNLLYFDVNPPHYFINYMGPLGPPSSPEKNFELFKVVKGKEEIENARSKLMSPKSYNNDGKLLFSVLNMAE